MLNLYAGNLNERMDGQSIMRLELLIAVLTQRASVVGNEASERGEGLGCHCDLSED